MSETVYRQEKVTVGPWTSAALLYGAFALAATMLFFPTVADMAQQWRTSSSFTHGFFVAPLAAVMIWRDRMALTALGPAPWIAPALIGVAAAALWVVGHAGGVALIEQFSFISILIAGALCIAGKKAASIIGFALLFLFFMVPFGETIVGPLQTMTSSIIVGALHLTGLAVSIDGFLIETSAGRFNVAEACAGLRFLIAASMIGAFFAHSAFHSWRKRILFVGIAALVAIAANGVRASLMVVIATATDMRWGVGDNHLFLGWIFYTLAFIALLFVGRKFADRTAPSVAPYEDQISEQRKLSTLALAPLIAAMIAATAYAQVVIDRTPSVAAPSSLPFINVPGWRIAPTEPAWRGGLAGADLERHGLYQRGASTIYLSAGYYTHDRDGAEVVNDGNRAFDGEAWRRIRSRSDVVYLFGRAEETNIDLLLGHGGQRLAAVRLHWLENGEVDLDPHRLKLAQAKRKLVGDNPRGGVIMIAATYASDEQTAIDAIRAFTIAAEPLEAWLKRIDSKTVK